MARNCGLNYWYFWPIGFLFGCFGLLVCACIYWFRKTINKQELDNYRGANPYQPQDYYSYFQEPEPAFPAPGPPPVEAYSMGSKTCANCHMNVPTGDEACWNCGALFTDRYTAKLCPVCQGKVPGDTGFCNNCGTKLDNVSPW